MPDWSASSVRAAPSALCDEVKQLQAAVEHLDGGGGGVFIGLAAGFGAPLLPCDRLSDMCVLFALVLMTYCIVARTGTALRPWTVGALIALPFTPQVASIEIPAFICSAT